MWKYSGGTRANMRSKSSLEECAFHLEGGTVITPLQSVIALLDFGYDVADVWQLVIMDVSSVFMFRGFPGNFM